MKLIRRKQVGREEMIEIIPALSKNSEAINLLCLQVIRGETSWTTYYLKKEFIREMALYTAFFIRFSF